MHIVVITPTRDQPEFLARCHASVGDQAVAGVTHVVMDAGTQPAAPQPARLSGSSPNPVQTIWRHQPDCGMYDALNAGFDLAEGEILAWLNSDEQYLPGTLRWVGEYFESHPEVDIVFGDFLVIDPAGGLLAFRKGCPPRWGYLLSSHLYVFSCAMFFRRRVWAAGLRFNPDFQSAGDQDFVVRALAKGFQARHVPRYVSVFTYTGGNLSSSAKARMEERRIRATAPVWLQRLRGPLNLLRLLEKAVRGAYRQTWPLHYAIFLDDVTRRTECVAQQGSWRWPARQRGRA